MSPKTSRQLILDLVLSILSDFADKSFVNEMTEWRTELGASSR